VRPEPGGIRGQLQEYSRRVGLEDAGVYPEEVVSHLPIFIDVRE
jgi:hypothetical protein